MDDYRFGRSSFSAFIIGSIFIAVLSFGMPTLANAAESGPGTTATNPPAPDLQPPVITVKTSTEPTLESAAPPITIPPTVNPPINTSLVPVNGKISFNFQNVPIKTLLQLLAKTSGINFIISDAVKGNTTLNLKNVTWQDALNIILKSNGLASQQIGNAIFVSTTDDITEKKAKELQSQQQLENLSPLQSTMITLRYTNAGKIADLLKGEKGSLLTSRGEVAVDSPTNTIIVRDIKSNLTDVVAFVKKLDKPARQVSIEARIVNIESSYEAQIGIRFGVSNTRSLSGTLTGANELAQGLNPANVQNIADRLSFNLPAAQLSSGAVPASIGLALARLGPVLLDLELSALEEEGHTQVVSKPRVVTANQQKATIQTGEEIPYQEATSSGATSIDFKKAVLSLEITPQITPDNRILLKLSVHQDTRGAQLLVANAVTTTSGAVTTPATFGPPTINTQQVDSYVMLNDNETVVLGGIYQLSKSSTYDRVPFFSDLPLIGRLFKHRAILNTKTELLIFLTPKIIKSEPEHKEYAAYEGYPRSKYGYKGEF